MCVCVFCSGMKMCNSHVFEHSKHTTHTQNKNNKSTRACVYILCDCTRRFYHVPINDRSKKKRLTTTETMTMKRKLEHVRLHVKPLFY